jgi:hypothetical protein
MTANDKAIDVPANKGVAQASSGKADAMKASILVVDDEVLVGEVICEWLKSDGPEFK